MVTDFFYNFFSANNPGKKLPSGKIASTIFLMVIFLSASFFKSAGQLTSDQQKINGIMQKIPGPSTQTVKGIADYIRTSFSGQSDRSLALFLWIAGNIQYDIDNMYSVDFYQNTSELTDKVLKTRKGVCMHYAELFRAVAGNIGINTYMVTGYTKQNGSVVNLPHAWCAARVDSVWYLFDPTWGAGYIQNAKYVNKLNTFYFKTNPSELIRSHMPFDPIWQLLSHPISNQEFYEGKTSADNTGPVYNFTDSIKKYEQQTEPERLVASISRIEKNGVRNAMISDWLQHNKREIEYINTKTVVDQFNAAVNSFNDGVRELNTFINYRNRQFTPVIPDNEIKQMVDVAENSLMKARAILKEIKNPDSSIATSGNKLNLSIDEAMNNLNEQKAFLEKYFKTGKLFRKSLFYKTTVFGIPVN